ncbi:structure-specific endonuclease subunit slx1-like isoform X2 [Paramacrobiotus metropolitanus]|uniref:structure-specific endonuclease subunit slx1-like isoform X2 n=1 Tax=Paramacrobiotus metropolitanus TaxID=2943436 RepID=UPI002445DADD|nr:structure-specific endonuclease subunit slx1-like isoform X2 [Paramacrobiotus metropolitanus]
MWWCSSRTVVVIVYGFMTNITALQFEWAWQHPEESRRLRHVTKKKARETALAYRIRIMMEMLCVEPWNRLPLTVQWLRSDLQVDFPSHLQPPDHIGILSGTVRAKKITPNGFCDLPVEENVEISDHDSSSALCGICSWPFEGPDVRVADVPGILVVVKAGTTESHTVTCLLPSCGKRFHLICLSQIFLKEDPGYLVPLRGKCPACSTRLLWADLIRFKRGFYRDCVLEPEGEQNLLSEINDTAHNEDDE